MRKNTVLTKKEREILILAAIHAHGEFLSCSEIAQRLGLSVNRVKMIMHQACVKLGARNRNQAVILALKREEIKITDFWSYDELSELIASLDTYTLRRMANIVRQELDDRQFQRKNERSIRADRRLDTTLMNIEMPDSTQMNTKETILTEKERNVLILSALHTDYNHLSNSEIAQLLDIPVNRVKILMHQTFTKLGAHNRIEAIVIALKRREIRINDIRSPDEIAAICGSLHPDALRTMAHIMRQEPSKRNYLKRKNKQTICVNRREDSILTKAERDVLILAALGLPNKEIADKLYISATTVTSFLNRTCHKLGVHKRSDAISLALKQREISIGDLYSFDELLEFFSYLGADFIEKMALLTDQKLEQEPSQTYS